MIYSNTILIYLFLIFISKGDIYFMNKDNQIFKYNNQIVTKNIVRLMKDNGVTQTELAEGIGVSQSRISDCLRGERDFTLSQFVAIAGFFRTSTDKLLGFTPLTSKADENTLADVLQKLFDISKIVDINIGTVEIPDQQALPFSDYTQNVPSFYFNDSTLQKILEEWAAVSSLTTQDNKMKEKLLRLWEEEALSAARLRKARWNFRNEEEEGERLYEYIMSCFDDCAVDLELRLSNNRDICITKEELELAEKYVQNNSLVLPEKAHDALAFAKKHHIELEFSK